MSEKSLKHTHKKPGTPLGRLNHECLDYVIYTFDIHKVERVEKNAQKFRCRKSHSTHITLQIFTANLQSLAVLHFQL